MNEPRVSPFNSETAFRESISFVLSLARQEVRIFDTDLASMKLEQKATVEMLGSLLSASPGNRLHIVVHHIDHIESHCPRLLALQANHRQTMEIRQSPQELGYLAEAYVLVDGTHGVLRHHVNHPRGKLLITASDEVYRWWQGFDELWSRATAWSPYRVGL